MYHGVSYVKKIPVMCRLHGQEHLLFREHLTTLFPEKVGAGTLGHPVDVCQENGQSTRES